MLLIDNENRVVSVDGTEYILSAFVDFYFEGYFSKKHLCHMLGECLSNFW